MRFDCIRAVLAGVALFTAGGQVATAQTATPDRWVGTWATASVAEQVKPNARPTTLREVVHVSRGGTVVRVTLSNALGTKDLRIAGTHVAVRAHDSTVQPGTDRALLFGGRPEVILPAGAEMVSDPLPFPLRAGSDLAISLLLPEEGGSPQTVHPVGLSTTWEADGDQLAAESLPKARSMESWLYLKNVEVQAKRQDAAIVAFGDSITDGYKSTANTNQRWPDVLADRLQAQASTRGMGVLNEGISANRVVHEGYGASALARLDRDVLAQSGVRYLIVLEGINDIGNATRSPADAVTVDQLTEAYAQIIVRAHAHGIRVYGATLTPFVGAGYASPAGEAMRQAVNSWIRAKGHFDAVIDFDQLTRDPSHPGAFAAANDSGDHLHPGDAGYRTMGESIDLGLFR